MNQTQLSERFSAISNSLTHDGWSHEFISSFCIKVWIDTGTHADISWDKYHGIQTSCNILKEYLLTSNI